MESQIIIIYALIFVIIWVLSIFPRSTVARIAFSWQGPLPKEDESWAKYQLRWASYSLDWLGQIIFIFLILHGIAYIFPAFQEHQIFLLFAAFALPIGAAMALLAIGNFLIKSAKARYIGPNPIYSSQQSDSPTQ